MGRTPFCCDFCGSTEKIQHYLVGDDETFKWYACADCASLIDAEHWAQLVEHSLAGYRQIRPIPNGEEPILREHVEQLVQAFRSFPLLAA